MKIKEENKNKIKGQYKGIKNQNKGIDYIVMELKWPIGPVPGKNIQGIGTGSCYEPLEIYQDQPDDVMNL